MKIFKITLFFLVVITGMFSCDGCEKCENGCGTDYYQLTITSSSNNYKTNSIDIYFDVRNDSTCDFDTLEFWIRFTENQTQETLPFSWDGMGDFLEVGNTLSFSCTASELDFSALQLDKLSYVNLIEADLYNYTENPDKLFTYEFQISSDRLLSIKQHLLLLKGIS